MAELQSFLDDGHHLWPPVWAAALPCVSPFLGQKSVLTATKETWKQQEGKAPWPRHHREDIFSNLISTFLNHLETPEMEGIECLFSGENQTSSFTEKATWGRG